MAVTPSKYDRSNFIPTVQVDNINGNKALTVLDTLAASYLLLPIDNLVYKSHQVTERDAGLPDAISYQYYGVSDLWWVLCYINGIVNPLVDLYVGLIIKIPNVGDLDFITSVTNTTHQQGQFVGV